MTAPDLETNHSGHSPLREQRSQRPAGGISHQPGPLEGPIRQGTSQSPEVRALNGVATCPMAVSLGWMSGRRDPHCRGHDRVITRLPRLGRGRSGQPHRESPDTGGPRGKGGHDLLPWFVCSRCAVRWSRAGRTPDLRTRAFRPGRRGRFQAFPSTPCPGPRSGRKRAPP